MANKLPAIQFYPGDWMKDPAVRSVSVAARGLWMDLLCIMHESPKRGYLMLESGAQIEHKMVSRMTGESQRSVKKLMNELETSGVFSRDENGAIYSRRMVKDEALRETRKISGSKGGNPILVNQRDNQDANQKPTPSSSSSISSSISEEDNPLTPLQGETASPPSEISIPETSNDSETSKTLNAESESGPSKRSKPDPEIPNSALAAAWLTAWNTNRGGLPAVTGVSGKRLKHALARLKSKELRDLGYRVPDDYAELIQKLAAHDFYGGRKGSFKADFDFLTRSDGRVVGLHEKLRPSMSADAKNPMNSAEVASARQPPQWRLNPENERWASARETLRDSMDPELFETWIEPIKPAMHGLELWLICPSLFVRNWNLSNFGDVIAQALGCDRDELLFDYCDSEPEEAFG